MKEETLSDCDYAPDWLIQREHASSSEDNQCLECAHWKEFEPPTVKLTPYGPTIIHDGNCRRYPPNVIREKGTSGEYFSFVSVCWNDFCGEFKRR